MKRLHTASATRALIHDLESHLPELMAKHKVPGITLALVRQAKIVWNRGYYPDQRPKRATCDQHHSL